MRRFLLVLLGSLAYSAGFLVVFAHHFGIQ